MSGTDGFPGAEGPSRRPRVIVVGAGFAGISAVRALEDTSAEVTLVDRNPFHTFQPLLYQVATGGLNPGDVAYPARSTVRRLGSTRFRAGDLVGVDWERREVLLDGEGTLGFDFLVLAIGASTNYFGIPGAEENSLPLYTIHQSIEVRDAIFGALERQAAIGTDGTPLQVVVVGGGPTGVEMAGTLAEVRNGLLPTAYPELSVEDVAVTLVEQQDHVLAGFDHRLQRYAAAQLRQRGVDLRLSTSVAEVRSDEVVLGSGEVLRRAVAVWAGGVTVPPLVARLGVPQVRGGRITVGSDLRVEGHPEAFAVGDVAATPLGDGLAPQLAQPAIQEGRHAAAQIGRLLEGAPTGRFVYHDKGIMATIGRRAAVVQLPRGIRLNGTLAWLAWLGLHLVILMGRRNRLSAFANLAWRYLEWPRGVKVIVGG